MKSLMLVICLTLIGSAFSGETEERSPESPEGENRHPATWRMTARANLLFAHRLYTNIAREHRFGNLLISPVTVSTALSMTLLGAKGNTAEELMEALGYNGLGTKRNGQNYTQDDVPRLYKSFLNKMRQSTLSKGFLLRMASKLYGATTEDFLDSFIQNTARYYGAPLEQVDFGSDPEGSRNTINNWVSEKTEQMIDEALPPDSITPETLIVLVSSVYFQGDWENQFDPLQTYEGKFQAHGKDGSERLVTVQYMKGTFNVKHGTYDRLQTEIVVLPYKSQDKKSKVQMELYLPATRTGLLELEQLKANNIHSATKAAKVISLEIHLPKIQIKDIRNLRENLVDLGVRTMFGGADLSGMNGKTNLNFGAVHHSTFMQVDEKGTKASAATSQVMTRSQPHTIVFNHPFFVIIRKIDSNSILFMARVANPLG